MAKIEDFVISPKSIFEAQEWKNWHTIYLQSLNLKALKHEVLFKKSNSPKKKMYYGGWRNKINHKARMYKKDKLIKHYMLLYLVKENFAFLQHTKSDKLLSTESPLGGK